MERREEKKEGMGELFQGHSSLQCDMCGRDLEPAVSSWQEDDDGLILCHDCMAERDSCGCSD